MAAVRNWHDAINHFEDYADEDRVRMNRFKPSVELVVAALVVLVFVGGYAAFIAVLALTR